MHLVNKHLNNPTYECSACDETFMTQNRLVLHYTKEHGITDEIGIKCNFKPRGIEERRKVWECLIDSTLPLKHEPKEKEDYALPELIAHCDDCRTMVNQQNSSYSSIIERLERHLYGRQHFNRYNYECDICSPCNRIGHPTETALLKHYQRDHIMITSFSIVYTLDNDFIEKQRKVLNCLIEVRRFLESRQTNSEQWPNMGTISNVPHASNQAVNGEPEIIWLKNDGTTENNVERKPRIQARLASIQAIDSDMETDQFAPKMFGQTHSVPTMTPNECRPALNHNSNNWPTDPPNFGDIFKEEDEFASLDSASVNGDEIEQMRSIESFQVRGSDIMTEDSNRTTDDYSAANLLSQTIGSVPLTMPNESCSSLEHNPITHQLNDTHSMIRHSNVPTILPPNMAISGSSEMQIDNPLENSHSSPNSNPSRDSGSFIGNGAGNGVNKSSPRQKRSEIVATTSNGGKRRGKKRQLFQNPKSCQDISHEQLKTNIPEITDDVAIEYLQEYCVLPKEGEVTCQQCGAQMTLRMRSDRRTWVCKCENRQGFGVNTFITAKKPVSKMLRFFYFWSCSNLSYGELAEKFGMNNKTIGEWSSNVRKACLWSVYNRAPRKKIGGPGMHVEVATRVIASRTKISEELWALGIVCRETEEIFMVIIPNREKKTLIPLLKGNVSKDSIIITDKFRSYSSLQHEFHDHWRVDSDPTMTDHPDAHIHTAESVFKRLENANAPRYGTNRKLVEGYLAEWLWKEKHKNCDAFKCLMKTIANFWPPGAKESKSHVVNLQELMENESYTDDNETDMDEQVNHCDHTGRNG
ncbi:ISXO2-like transposase domain-containing protein [Ditylenchus destructor]|uniref:ISXO2-like transposase domain-containing protein n=1 Tax=Ditylenchus destructor TaxID=166010 RepID=A0AAD4MJ19_9BILA|nr:ISXO2-like transposase domain-containing protein [Ditylenchus destructor]